jgi:hypothetical protein
MSYRIPSWAQATLDERLDETLVERQEQTTLDARRQRVLEMQENSKRLKVSSPLLIDPAAFAINSLTETIKEIFGGKERKPRRKAKRTRTKATGRNPATLRRDRQGHGARRPAR